jgi:hypothetical protein
MNMGKVYQKVIDQFEKNPRGFQEELGKLAGYSSGSNFSRALKENRNIQILEGFVKVIEKLFPENFKEILIEYAYELDPKKMTICLLLEYATLYYMYDLVKVINEIMKSSDKKNIIDWAEVYEIHRKVQTREISRLEGIQELMTFNKSKVEIRVFAKIAMIYCYYDMRNISMINLAIDEIESEVNLIKNDFLRNSFIGRIFRIKVDINLHTDKIGTLVESLFQIENALDPTKTMVYLQIGNSYMTKSYEKAMYYFNKALEYKTTKSEFEIKQSINFTSCLWDRLENFRSDGTSSNDLFYYIKSGNKSEAERLLKRIDFDKLNAHQKAFNCFYQGLLYNDKKLFYKSVELFNGVGEKFYRQLPIMELKKMDENDYILSALSA